MTDKIKKIISREGAVSLILLIGVIFLFVGNNFFKYRDKALEIYKIPESGIISQSRLNAMVAGEHSSTRLSQQAASCSSIGFILINFYFLLMLIRFIIWVVRRLRTK